MLVFENVTGISKKFALNQITFNLPPGYIMGLVGKNGAGKTTLFHYILDKKKNYTGTIKLAGRDIRENHTAIKNKIGFVSEENEFFLNWTGSENAKALGILYDDFSMEEFFRVADLMEFAPEKKYHAMSRGERLKFQMAFAMAHHPNIYLLDEVTAGMDPVFRKDFFKILQEVIREEQASVLMTTHIESELQQKTDFVGILEQGRLIHFGESLDIYERSF
jgi:ABC-2 type transport system ATP-binding protein